MAWQPSLQRTFLNYLYADFSEEPMATTQRIIGSQCKRCPELYCVSGIGERRCFRDQASYARNYFSWAVERGCKYAHHRTLGGMQEYFDQGFSVETIKLRPFLFTPKEKVTLPTGGSLSSKSAREVFELFDMIANES